MGLYSTGDLAGAGAVLELSPPPFFDAALERGARGEVAAMLPSAAADDTRTIPSSSFASEESSASIAPSSVPLSEPPAATPDILAHTA